MYIQTSYLAIPALSLLIQHVFKLAVISISPVAVPAGGRSSTMRSRPPLMQISQQRRLDVFSQKLAFIPLMPSSAWDIRPSRRYCNAHLSAALSTRWKVLVRPVLLSLLRREQLFDRALASNDNREEDGIWLWGFDESQRDCPHHWYILPLAQPAV